MVKLKKCILFIGLATSLSLDCSFQAFKNVSKAIVTGCLKTGRLFLTTGVLLHGASSSLSKESVALHESGHAVVAEIQGEGSVIDVYVAQDLVSYRGCCRISEDDFMTLQKRVSINMAGYAQDLQDKQRQRDLNFLESELGFPLSNIATNTHAQLQNMHDYIKYKSDITNSTKNAYRIALKEFNIEDDDYSYLDISIKKQIDDRVQQILIDGLDEAKKIVKAHQKEIHAIANILYKREFLFGDDVREVMNNPKVINPAAIVLYEKELAEEQKNYGYSIDVREILKKR